MIITQVSDDSDVHGILQLQQQNLKKNLTQEAIDSQGFVTVEHTYEVMKRMNDALPSVIAKDGEKVVGYVIAMLPQFAEDVPVLVGLFEMINDTEYMGKRLSDFSHIVVGQLCVGEGYRGIGLVDKLYAHYRDVFSQDFELCITDISSKNPRSRKAHEKVGFQVVRSFHDNFTQETWDLVVWDWRNISSASS